MPGASAEGLSIADEALADDFETLRCPSALLDSEECFSQDSEVRSLAFCAVLLKGLPIQLRQLAQMRLLEVEAASGSGASRA